jgi:hypothetical protein
MEKISHSKVGGDNTVALVVEHCVGTWELFIVVVKCCMFFHLLAMGRGSQYGTQVRNVVEGEFRVRKL